MKRFLFYLLLLLQIAILFLLGVQYYFIDDYGRTVQLLSKHEEMTDTYGSYNQHMTYIDYEINFIAEDAWEIAEEVDYNTKIYVLLESDSDGVFHIAKANDQKIDAEQDQVVLQGRYQYYNDMQKEYHVTYGIESFHPDFDFNRSVRDQSIITIQLAPWGQKKVTDIEN